MSETCQHEWVLYQPFQGDAYECCAKAGCGIRRTEYEKDTQMTFDDLRTDLGYREQVEKSMSHPWIINVPEGTDWFSEGDD